MDQNVGRSDRIVRVGLGTGLLIVGVLAFAGLFGVGSSPAMLVVKFVLVLLGAVLAVTGLTQSCPIYSVLGMNTR